MSVTNEPMTHAKYRAAFDLALEIVEAEVSEIPIVAPGTNAAWDECARTIARRRSRNIETPLSKICRNRFGDVLRLPFLIGLHYIGVSTYVFFDSLGHQFLKLFIGHITLDYERGQKYGNRAMAIIPRPQKSPRIKTITPTAIPKPARL